VKTIGELGYQAAVFIYKDDSTAARAWGDVEAIHTDHGGIRAELHNDRTELLAGLKAWSESVDPSNAFLCIYAHMGPPGINCISGKSETRVTWEELAKSLAKGVELIWLVGCKSGECLKKWTPLSSPVRHLLLATSASKPWRPLLKCFAAEIDIKHIRYYDEMPDYLSKVEPELGKLTTYFRPTPKGFKKAF
jgi:hypothetical protein